MPRTALFLGSVFVLLALGWRGWMQHRRTGDTGLRPPSHGAGAMERVAGALLIIGAVGLLASPLWLIFDLAAPLRALDGRIVEVLGVALACAGIALTVLAEFQMGDSWRVGVDPSETTALVDRGLFGYIRNPIYSGMLLFGAGLFCLVPTLAAAAAGLLLLLGVELQVRGVEEPYLARKHGQAYHEYARTAGRFVPWLGRLAQVKAP